MDENGWKWPTMDEMDGVGWNGCKWIGSGVQSIEHSNVLREKNNFTAHGSANWYVTERVKFCHFGESQIKGTPQIGVYPKKFNIGFLAQIFLGAPAHVWKLF